MRRMVALIPTVMEPPKNTKTKYFPCLTCKLFLWEARYGNKNKEMGSVGGRQKKQKKRRSVNASLGMKTFM